jgi:hypothetical protein
MELTRQLAALAATALVAAGLAACSSSPIPASTAGGSCAAPGPSPLAGFSLYRFLRQSQ